MPVIGTLLGKAIFGNDAFGRKPQVPDLPPIDPAKVQAQTIADNQAALPGAQQTAGEVNKFNVQQQLATLTQALNFLSPGSADTLRGTVASQLRGEVPEDVQRQLLRQSVSGAFGRGYGAGSRIASNDYLRNFGLTSLQMQQQGLANFQSTFAPKSPLMDVTSMFFTPQQRLQAAFAEREGQFNQQWMKAQVRAAPDPFAAAMTQAIIQDEAAILEIAGNALGMVGGFGACWIARAVLGTTDDRWRLVRMWLLTEAPGWFRDFYLANGEKLAASLTEEQKLLLVAPFNRIANHIAQRYARIYDILATR